MRIKSTEELKRDAHDRYIEVMSRREELLTAFIAKYGCEPDEIEILEQHVPEGVIVSVRKKPGLILSAVN
jgi:hypothetical protein